VKCERLTLRGGFSVIVCSRGGKPSVRIPNCRWCEKRATKLCDWPEHAPLRLFTHIGTCDAPMCSDHATHVGTDRDYCPLHTAQGKLPLQNPSEEMP